MQYNYLCKYLIVTPNNLTAASIGELPCHAPRWRWLTFVSLAVVQYWIDPGKFPIAPWITIFIVIIIAINFCGVRVFGEIEFWMSLFKVRMPSDCLVPGHLILTPLPRLSPADRHLDWIDYLWDCDRPGRRTQPRQDRSVKPGFTRGGGLTRILIGFRYWKQSPFSHYLFQ